MFFLLIVLIVFGSRPPLRRFMADASVAVAVVAADLQEVYLFIYFHFVALRHLTPLAVSFVWLISCLISPVLFFLFSKCIPLVNSSLSIWVLLKHFSLFSLICISFKPFRSHFPQFVRLCAGAFISNKHVNLQPLCLLLQGRGKKRISLHLLAWQTCKDSTLPNIFNRFLIGTP